MEVSLKNPIFRCREEEEVIKHQYIMEKYLERGAPWTFCRFKEGEGGLGPKERVVFLRGVDTPMNTM